MNTRSTPDFFNDIKKRYYSNNISSYTFPHLVGIREEDIEERQKNYADVLDTGALFMNRFLNDVDNTPMAFGITDDQGYFLKLGGDKTIQKQFDLLGLKVGVALAEELTSIHLALKYQRSFAVIGKQHFHHVFHSIACFSSPLYDGEHKLIGTVGIMTTEEFATPFYLTMLSMIAESIEREIKLKQVNGQLLQMAMTDGLTGLPNRRYFNELLYKEAEKTEQSFQPLSLILLDVDHFKLYNDRYGHEVGDECLLLIGRELMNLFLDSSYTPFRYGGEEFAVLLPNLEKGKAIEEAEKIRNKIMELEIPNTQSGPITISAGVETISRNEPERLFSKADQALYIAKENGCNRVYATV